MTNNEKEYETLIAGLNIASKLKVTSLYAFYDSQIIVNQVQAVYQAKEEKLK